MEDRGERLTRIRGAFEAAWSLMRSGDYERMLQAFDPQVEYIDHRPGGVDPVRGHDDLRRLWSLVFPAAELDAQVVDMPADDQVLTLEVYRVPGAQDTVAHGLYTIRFGRIVRAEFFSSEADARAAARAAALRAPGA